MPVIVTANTRLADLIHADPRLPEALRSSVPALQPAMVWDSVAKAATLGQIAVVAGAPFPELVRRLRDAGADLTVEDAPPSTLIASSPPAKHPLGQVRTHAEQLAPSESIRLTFIIPPRPADRYLHRGRFLTHTVEAAPGRFVTYILRPR